VISSFLRHSVSHCSYYQACQGCHYSHDTLREGPTTLEKAQPWRRDRKKKQLPAGCFPFWGTDQKKIPISNKAFFQNRIFKNEDKDPHSDRKEYSGLKNGLFKSRDEKKNNKAKPQDFLTIQVRRFIHFLTPSQALFRVLGRQQWTNKPGKQNT
jgi:hypothetical protein